MTHMHLQDVELWRLASLFGVFVLCVLIFVLTGKDNDDGPPPSAGPNMKLKGI